MEIILAPLASASQVRETPSRRDGIPADLEEDLRSYGAILTSPQETSGHVDCPSALPTILVHKFNGEIRNCGKSPSGMSLFQ
jgi:hypothetical protein